MVKNVESVIRSRSTFRAVTLDDFFRKTSINEFILKKWFFTPCMMMDSPNKCKLSTKIFRHLNCSFTACLSCYDLNGDITSACSMAKLDTVFTNKANIVSDSRVTLTLLEAMEHPIQSTLPLRVIFPGTLWKDTTWVWLEATWILLIWTFLVCDIWKEENGM